jgi:hypothetical protein
MVSRSLPIFGQTSLPKVKNLRDLTVAIVPKLPYALDESVGVGNKQVYPPLAAYENSTHVLHRIIWSPMK